MTHEIGDQSDTTNYRGDPQYLVRLDGNDFSNHTIISDEVIVIDREDGSTAYVFLNEGSKECFLIAESHEDYPLPKVGRSYLDVNFYGWLANQEGEVYTVPNEEVEVCDWRA